MKNNFDYSQLEKNINYKFNNRLFLEIALTHSSFLNESKKKLENNERLEFLGDSILNFVVTDFLFQKYRQEKEGILTIYKSSLINYRTLFLVGQELKLELFFNFSKGSKKLFQSGHKENILADGVEAIIGAIFLDSHLEAAKKFILEFVIKHFETILDQKLWRDHKTYLQENIQELKKITPTYQVLEEIGQDHNKQFISAVFFNQEKISEGRGDSKKKSEQAAAKQALISLNLF